MALDPFYCNLFPFYVIIITYVKKCHNLDTILIVVWGMPLKWIDWGGNHLSMKKKNLFFAIVLSILIPSLWITSWTASCSGGGSLSQTTGSEEESGEFITGEPIDIPAPIAKSIDGIDPTSVTFEATGSELVKSKSTVLAETESSVGTLSASTIGLREVLVGLVVDAEFREIKLAEGGEVSFSLGESDVGTNLALTVLSDDSTEEDIVEVSNPVIVTLTDVNGELVLITSVTNISSGSSEASVDIVKGSIAFSEDEQVYFTANDTDGTPLFGLVDVNTGTYGDFPAWPGNGLGQLSVEPDGDPIFGVDLVTGALYYGTPEGGWESDEGVVIPTTNRNYCVSADLTMVASNVAAGDSDGGDGMLINIHDITTDEDTGVTLTGGELNGAVTQMDCDWVDNENLVIAKVYEDGQSIIHLYPLGGAPTPSEMTITPVTISSLSTLLKKGVKSGPDDDSVAFRCNESGTTQVSLCFANPTDGTVTVFDDSGSITEPHFNADNSGIVFELDTTLEDDDLDGSFVVFWNLSSGQATYLVPGGEPVFHPTEKNLIAYLAEINGTIQISVLNLDNFTVE